MLNGVLDKPVRNALLSSATLAGEGPGDAPYRLPGEHLRDLLRRLDLQLRRLLVGRTTRDATDFLSFAAISDSEVVRLLGALDEPSVQPAAESRALTDATAALEAQIERRLAAGIACGLRAPLPSLAARLGLGRIEQDLLVLAAAAELDRRYERIFGYLQDDMGRKLPSLGLALAVCGPGTDAGSLAARLLLSRSAPLRRHRLVEVVDDGQPAPSLAKGLRIDERILGFLLGETTPDARLADAWAWQRGALPAAGRVRALPPTPPRARAVARLQALVAGWDAPEPDAPRPLVYVAADPGCGAEDLVAEVAAAAGLAVFQVDLGALAGADLPEVLPLAFREAGLAGAALCLREVDAVFDAAAGGACQRVLERTALGFRGLLCLVGQGPWRWPLPRAPLVLRPLSLMREGFVEQLQVWRGLIDSAPDGAPAGGAAGPRIDERALERLVSRHPLPAARIAGAWRMACDQARLRGEPVAITDLELGCRTGAPPPNSGLTRLIEPRHAWADLVLPSAQGAQLQAMCSQATHLATVYGAWGFEDRLALGKGISALFSGPPGTGKTMAAEVIAAELELPLLKIDLSQVVSKYIGETEKNLRALFDQAAAGHAILFFDEADALLGKRSAVGDAHDRYANTEVAYLLQKMEEFEGIAILATNLRQNMDEAFTRRMRFVIDFPFPEEDDRLRIWQGVWPPGVPLAPDLDLPRMAQQFRLAGGSIRNIAVASAFMAAAERRPLDMGHLLQAARRELQKMGRLVTEGEERFRV